MQRSVSRPTCGPISSSGSAESKLKGFGKPTYRLRIGAYRVVYRISRTVVVILRIIPRSELERALRDLA
jgi:mRNA-degrading endonuclease RelE of RelBE toxin-antitoxin system